MSVLRRTLLVAAVCLGVTACLSPTLPLPPPGEPTIEQVGQQQYRFSGRVKGARWVVALNQRTEALSGDLSEGDGEYSFVVTARPDDEMSLWYSIGEELSSPLKFAIEDLYSTPADGGAPEGDAGAPAGDGSP